MEITATIDAGDGATTIHWKDGAVVIDGGGPLSATFVDHLAHPATPAVSPTRGAYLGFDLRVPEELRAAVAHAAKRGFKAKVLTDTAPVAKPLPARVPLDDDAAAGASLTS
jgi:L-2-hydroxyglutarate oxidase LhgO